MLIMFKTTVAVAGTPGPLLGDGTNTTVTMLYPSALAEAGDTLGSRSSVINSAATPRKSYAVARLSIIGAGDNSDVAYLLARGSAKANGRRVAAYEELPPIGFGDRNDINLADFDVDVESSGDDIIVFAEVR